MTVPLLAKITRLRKQKLLGGGGFRHTLEIYGPVRSAPAPRKRTSPTNHSMSSVDGSRVARSKLTQWHWSGAVFCPAC